MFTLFVISCAVISLKGTYRGSYTPLMKNTQSVAALMMVINFKNL